MMDPSALAVAQGMLAAGTILSMFWIGVMVITMGLGRAGATICLFAVAFGAILFGN
jgi:hypothetical protein